MQKTMIFSKKTLLAAVITALSLSQAALQAENKPGSLKHLASMIAKTAKTIEQESKTCDDVDDFLAKAMTTIGKSVEKINKTVPQDQLATCGQACIESASQAWNAIEKIIKEHATVCGEIVENTLDENTKKFLEQEMLNCFGQIGDSYAALNLDTQLKTLSGKISEVVKPDLQSMDEAAKQYITGSEQGDGSYTVTINRGVEGTTTLNFQWTWKMTKSE